MKYCVVSATGETLVLRDALGHRHLVQSPVEALTVGAELHGPNPATGLVLMTGPGGQVIRAVIAQVHCDKVSDPVATFGAHAVAVQGTARPATLATALR